MSLGHCSYYSQVDRTEQKSPSKYCVFTCPNCQKQKGAVNIYAQPGFVGFLPPKHWIIIRLLQVGKYGMILREAYLMACSAGCASLVRGDAPLWDHLYEQT